MTRLHEHGKGSPSRAHHRIGPHPPGRHERQPSGHYATDLGSSPRTGARSGVLAVVIAAVAGYLGTQALVFATSGKPGDDPRTAIGSLMPATNPPATNPPTINQPGVTAPNDPYAPGAATGPGPTGPGITVQVQPNPQGHLEAVEHVRFTTPATDLMIRPPSTKGAAGDVAALKPRVSGLQVWADGEVVSVPTGIAMMTGSSRLQLTQPARTLTLRYRVEGAVARSIPGPPGRALILLPPISATPIGSSLPVVVTVSGGHVRNLICPGLDQTRQLCGTFDGPVWSTTAFEAGTTAVVAQVDLPTPGA